MEALLYFKNGRVMYADIKELKYNKVYVNCFVSLDSQEARENQVISLKNIVRIEGQDIGLKTRVSKSYHFKITRDHLNVDL